MEKQVTEEYIQYNSVYIKFRDTYNIIGRDSNICN